MIRIEELRVGNRILFGEIDYTIESINGIGCGLEKKYGRILFGEIDYTIESINGIGCGLEKKYGDDIFAPIHSIKPIPITEKHLIELGFEKTEVWGLKKSVPPYGIINAYSKVNGKFLIELSNKSGYAFKSMGNIHLHQLQNLITDLS